MAKHDDWTWLTNQVHAAIDAYVAQLDGLTGSEKVPNLDWSVAELTAHLASLPSVYAHQHALAEDFVRADDMAQWSIDQRSHIATDDLDAVRALLRSEVEEFISGIGEPDEHRWLYGSRTTHRNLLGAILVELVVHGQDLGKLTGGGTKLTSDQAKAGLANVMAIAPSFVDHAKAAKLPGTYQLSFRGGGGEWFYRIDDKGQLTVTEGKADRADARLSADAAAFMLVSLGRMNPFLPAFKGQTLAYGRKPWKLLALGDIVVDGV